MSCDAKSDRGKEQLLLAKANRLLRLLNCGQTKNKFVINLTVPCLLAHKS